METLRQVPVTPAAPAAAPAPSTTPEAPKQDLMSRVMAAPDKVAETPATPAQNESPKVSVRLDDIKDPAARAMLEQRLKEANEGISRTFGELGTEKQKILREVEAAKKEAEDLKKQYASWSPERLRQELQRQDFIQAAQQLQSQAAPQQWVGSTDEWSALSEQEKQQFSSVIQSQKQMGYELETMKLAQIDERLKTKYPDFDSSQVDKLMLDANQGRLPQDRVREMVHVALNAERMIKRAYELGQQDRGTSVQEKVNAISTPSGLTTTMTTEKPSKKEGENSQTYLSRLLRFNLEKVKEQSKR